MNCPKCDMYSPDGSAKCDSCGHDLSPQSHGSAYVHPRRPKPSPMAKNIILFASLAVALILIIAIFLMQSSQNQKSYSSGSFVPGQRYDITRLIEPNQTTIIDFYSKYCGPCRQISPLLDQLDEKRDDLVVKRVDINRKGVRGIDWRSPIVKQYNIRSIPYFFIYNERGKRTHKGRAAKQEIMRLFRQENIRTR